MARPEFPNLTDLDWLRTYGGKTYVPAILMMNHLGDDWQRFAELVKRVQGVGLDPDDCEEVLADGFVKWLQFRTRKRRTG